METEIAMRAKQALAGRNLNEIHSMLGISLSDLAKMQTGKVKNISVFTVQAVLDYSGEKKIGLNDSDNHDSYASG